MSPHFDSRPLRIVVLLGGESAEREVSLKSGAAVSQALRSRGHAVVEVDPAETSLAGYDWRGADAAFIALHGTYGEDGGVQTVLQTAGVPYTGSGPQASRLAFSKSAAKERFALHRVPTPAYVLIHESDTADRIRRQAAALGYPLVVKPDAQGSSLGVSIVTSPEELPQALSRCFHYDHFGLLECYVPGTEWTVGMIDDDPLPLIRIRTDRGFFDFQAKYEDDGTRYEFEFDVPAEGLRRIESAAQNACRGLGTRGLARVDLILDKQQRPWVLEVNTVPGLTDHSLVPKAAARKGLPFAELCERLVRSCLHGQKVATPARAD